MTAISTRSTRLADDITTVEVQVDSSGAAQRGVFRVPRPLIDDSSLHFASVVGPGPNGKTTGPPWDAVSSWKEFFHLSDLQHSRRALDADRLRRLFDPCVAATEIPLPPSSLVTMS